MAKIPVGEPEMKSEVYLGGFSVAEQLKHLQKLSSQYFNYVNNTSNNTFR